ncbi:hypothetical protein PWT90_10618 [Aphanocladium album]|nr:hypothetical protein PWT90_10618 [Aphanocladium album]
MKFLATAILLLATEAVATRVAYSFSFTEGGIEGKGGKTTKNGKSIPDDKEQSVIDHIGEWSDHKYAATKSGKGVNLITVTNVHPPKTSGEAKDQLADAQKIVIKHTK